MRNLEEITRDLFQNFCKKKFGKSIHWHLLSKERQVEWLEETYLLLTEVTEILQKEMNIKAPDKTPMASFEAGVLAGMNKEQQRLLAMLKNIKSKYLKDFKDFVQ